jgi:DNA modification methylase
VKPYYDDGQGIVIYHGDWRGEVGDALAASPIDAVVTDPPYGIGADRRQAARAGKQGGKAVAPSRDYGHSDWDQAPPERFDLDVLRAMGNWHIFWGGNHLDLPPSPGWLVWDKVTGANGYADAELAWTDLRTAVRLIRFQWMGMLQQLPEQRYHPTQKPLPIMRWCLSLLPEHTEVILDPYMGSGTTLRAAKDMGLRAIGVEAEERYCEVAANRLEQGVLDLGYEPSEAALDETMPLFTLDES